MSVPHSDLIAWAAREAKSTHRWAMFYLALHNWLTVLSFGIAIAIPFGLAMMLYLSDLEAQRWNIFLLVISGLGLVLQVVNSVMRFKERAVQGRNIAKILESASLKYQSGHFDRDQFHSAIDRYVERVTDEPLP